MLIDTPGLASMSDGRLAAHAALPVHRRGGPGRRRRRDLPDAPPAPDGPVVPRGVQGQHRHAGATVNSIAVISRADEIGSARTNAMATAERIADRYRADPRINALCQVVIPVAGLIAQAAATLRQDESNALRAIAAAGPQPLHRAAAVGAALRRRRRTGRARAGGPRPAARPARPVRRPPRRRADRRRAGATRPASWPRELEARSGIGELRPVLGGQFAATGGGAQGPLDAGHGLGARRAPRRAEGPRCCATASATSSGPPTSSSRSACCPSCAAAPSSSATSRRPSRRRGGCSATAAPRPNVRLGLPAGASRRRGPGGGAGHDRPLAHRRRGPAPQPRRAGGGPGRRPQLRGRRRPRHRGCGRRALTPMSWGDLRSSPEHRGRRRRSRR